MPAVLGPRVHHLQEVSCASDDGGALARLDGVPRRPTD